MFFAFFISVVILTYSYNMYSMMKHWKFFAIIATGIILIGASIFLSIKINYPIEKKNI